MNQRIRALQELGEELERAVVSAPAQPQPPSSGRWRVGRLVHRAPSVLAPVGAVLITVMVVLAVVLLVRSGHHQAVPKPIAPGAEHTYTDPQGWSLSYPTDFWLATGGPPAGALSNGQVTLTSFPAARHLAGHEPAHTPLSLTNQTYTLPLNAAGRFPSDGAALILQPSRATELGADSAFPIALSQFKPLRVRRFFSAGDRRRAAIPPTRRREIVFYSQPITLTAIIGAHAPARLRRRFAEVVASLSIRQLSPGDRVGTGELLGAAKRYPVGSFTPVRMHVPGEHGPVYLIHAPGHLSYGHSCLTGGPCVPAGAFYGLNGQYNTRRQNAPACRLRLDRQRLQFYCTNLGVRWDRVGRVISRPANESYIGDLEGLDAKIAWDGQVMIAPGFGPQRGPRAVHRLWPGWHQPNESPSR